MSPLPETCDVAFKEWASVCDALARGRQSLILRKGGVAERGGPGHFVPEHANFWLYPTWVHQAEQGVRAPAAGLPALHQPGPPSQIPIRALACVTLLGYVQNEPTLNALEPFHILTRETVRARFHYRTPGLWALAARVWCRSPEFGIAFKPEHAGCKTWVPLDAPLPTAGLRPAIDDVEWASLEATWRTLLDAKSPSDLTEQTYV